MGVTSGFRRLSTEDLSRLTEDAAAFELECRNYDIPDYLDMDKAGIELIFILDPVSMEFDTTETEDTFPGLMDVLAGGAPLHEQIDLGYGPARVIPAESLRESLEEMASLTQEQFTELALGNEILSEMLMCELEESMIQEYHWPYLQSLSEFLRESLDQGMTVIRY